MTDVKVLLCTCPPERAEELAAALVERRLAACVNIVPGISSVYRWQGDVQRDQESLLIVKTTARRVAALRDELPALHPYDTPELLVLPVEDGLRAYVDWVIDATKD